MQYFTIMRDYICHTVVYLVKANSIKEALEKFSISEAHAKQLKDGRWLIKDYGNKKFDEYYDSIESLVEGYWKKSSQRFEIHGIDLDLQNDVQEIFCSKEKIIE